MAEKLKENEGAFWKNIRSLIMFLTEKEFNKRMLPKSSNGKEELKHFDFIKNNLSVGTVFVNVCVYI